MLHPSALFKDCLQHWTLSTCLPSLTSITDLLGESNLHGHPSIPSSFSSLYLLSFDVAQSSVLVFLSFTAITPMTSTVFYIVRNAKFTSPTHISLLPPDPWVSCFPDSVSYWWAHQCSTQSPSSGLAHPSHSPLGIVAAWNIIH